ncbi:SAM-dependent methyltransferase [Actinoplanes sp. NPDC089786]|uniref:SAM-dependent methyltransferase n=1 Tax=Actinoplanes sp. NPDC089786 TaxID=3155185 RepID=UPI0034255AC8
MTNAPTLPDGVGWTAVLVAAQRAAESLSGAPAFRDPLAEAIVVHLGLAGPGEQPRFDAMPGDMAGLTTMMGDLVVLRTLHNDRVITESGVEQVVLLGAGLDGRAYRLPGAGRIFELDLAPGLALKEEAARAAGLQTLMRRTAVPADLAGEWASALLAAGFDPSRPTAWIGEGLTIYLDRSELDGLLTRVRDLSAPGSRLCLEIASRFDAGLADEEVADNGTRRLETLLREGPPIPPHDWLIDHGWSARHHTLVELGERHGREVTRWFDADRGGATLWMFTSSPLPRPGS